MSDRVKFLSGEPDGASAVAHELDTIDTLVDASAKLLQVKNDGTLEFQILQNGVGWFSAGLYVNADDKWNNGGVSIGGGTNSLMAIQGQVATGGSLRFKVTEGVGLTLKNTMDMNTSGHVYISPAGLIAPGLPLFSLYNNTGAFVAFTVSSTGRVKFGGAQEWAHIQKATTFQTDGTATVIGVTDTSAPRTISLANGQDNVDGRIIIVKDESGAAGTNNITVNTFGGGNIEGLASYVINTNYGSVALYSDGSNWFVIGVSSGAAGSSDNLGNHTATMDLDLNGWDLIGGVDVSITGVLNIDATQVVGSQQGAVADAATTTTVGANTGTSAAGLSLIGDTSGSDQSAALMNDLVALQEDILDLRTQLNAALAALRAHGLIAT